MRYKQFYPGDRVVTIVNYDGIPSDTIGKIASKWSGTVYLLKLPDGTFRWISDRAFAPADLSGRRIEEGDFGVVTSNKQNNFAEVGEKLQVVKILHDVDFYGVLINGELHGYSGFQLAPYK